MGCIKPLCSKDGAYRYELAMSYMCSRTGWGINNDRRMLQ
jgi:hypothetical protein